MDTEFLVEMRQSNKCGSFRNDEILNLHLGYGTGKEPRNEIQLPTNRNVLPWHMYTEPRAKKGRLGT